MTFVKGLCCKEDIRLCGWSAAWFYPNVPSQSSFSHSPVPARRKLVAGYYQHHRTIASLRSVRRELGGLLPALGEQRALADRRFGAEPHEHGFTRGAPSSCNL